MSRTLTPLRSIICTSKPKPPNRSLFTLNRLLSTTPRHHIHPSPSRPQSSSPAEFPFRTGPSPPRLPKEEQELFEALQRQSTGAFSTPRDTPASQRRTAPRINQSPDSNPSDIADAEGLISSRTDNSASESHQSSTSSEIHSQSPVEEEQEINRVIEARGSGEELHPAVRRGATPEFEGDVNPKTGEVGGPKNEPLRWGSAGEWSYNGRTTDF
ncbi:hypothetical protein EPUS_08030 [Endocarpon pusillum Z07020]|uniref:Succinate dehydrogenase assembly factor 4, mitochondrial n=1 Tax=Endocarpon pusillum (strain Z07020 / HMAS-L-300199) TaxID=1263415 RepID=U1HLF0_ENDPU|nr:uncharacterized protein EPUS_08030 [Endocarpon pusillum Z07020]ERF69829.1 hypothetical protein EPUS_08030 [Endocarpon pusillum Z07020]